MNKKLILLFIAGLLVLGYSPELRAQDDADDPMWVAVLLTPDNTKLKTLEENMRTYNQKYHNEGYRNANVYRVVTGPNTGKLVWMMGPLTFTDLDNGPVDGAREYWRDNVMPNIKKMTQTEFWQGDNKLSNTSMMTGDA